MSNNSKILYITHDSHAPSGGVKTIYPHSSLGYFTPSEYEKEHLLITNEF
jgi:hypothetical protein